MNNEKQIRLKIEDPEFISYALADVLCFWHGFYLGLPEESKTSAVRGINESIQSLSGLNGDIKREIRERDRINNAATGRPNFMP